MIPTPEFHIQEDSEEWSFIINRDWQFVRHIVAWNPACESAWTL